MEVQRSQAPTLPSPATAGEGRVGDGERMRRAAQDFEAQALGALMQPMFAGLETRGPFSGGAAEAQWRPMLVEAMARDLARAGGIGLADSVLREMVRLQERRTTEESGT